MRFDDALGTVRCFYYTVIPTRPTLSVATILTWRQRQEQQIIGRDGNHTTLHEQALGARSGVHKTSESPQVSGETIDTKTE